MSMQALPLRASDRQWQTHTHTHLETSDSKELMRTWTALRAAASKDRLLPKSWVSTGCGFRVRKVTVSRFVMCGATCVVGKLAFDVFGLLAFCLKNASRPGS